MTIFTGDKDDYTAIQRHVEKILKENRLSSHVSVHNLSAVTDYSKPALIFCIWPVPSKGYNAQALFEVQRKIRNLCSEQKPPICLIGHSTDSAGFSHSLAKWIMTPQQQLISSNIEYLGLGIEEEKYMAPYFWQYPTIMYLDFEHNQRSCLRMLKYSTLDMLMADSNPVTINHVMQLREICITKNIEFGLSEKDLLMVKFFDQNSDAAYNLFSMNIVNLLQEHVAGSLGTQLYISMIIYMMEPFRNVAFGTPLELVKSIATGLTMLRLWRQYLKCTGRKLSAQNGAKTTPSKRGNFITSQTYDSLEIQCHAAIQHQLALYLHSPQDGHNYAVPKNASTIATERFIGQSQAKTSHLQSLNQEPSVAETIDRAGKIQHNIETLHQLAENNVQTSATSNRKKTISKFTSHKSHSSYKYPLEYSEFIEELKTAFCEGVSQGQKEMEKLPSEFKEVLVKNNLWEKPMTFLY